MNTCELQSSTGSSDLDPRDMSILFHAITPSYLTGSLSLVLVPSSFVKVSFPQGFTSSGFYHFYNVCLLLLVINFLVMDTWRGVCGPSLTAIAGSNAAGGMDVSLFVSVVIVQRSPTECRVSVCDFETFTMRRARPTRARHP